MQRVRGLVARRGGRGRCCGARGHGGVTRGRRWLQLRRQDNGGCVGHGFGGARERGRGRMRCPRGRGGDVELAQVSWPRGRQAADAVASSCSPASPLCLPGEGEAAGWHGPAQCWAGQVGCQVGCGQVSPSFSFISNFLFFCKFMALFKIVRHF